MKRGPTNRTVREAIRAELDRTGRPDSFFARMAAQVRIIERLQATHGGDLLELTQLVAPHFAQMAGR